VKWVKEEPQLFSNEQQAMVDLGVGKNMVRAIRFWALAADMIEPAGKGSGHRVTAFGSAILGDEGADPFLEDIRTLWLVHWKLSTSVVSPLLAWDYLLNYAFHFGSCRGCGHTLPEFFDIGTPDSGVDLGQHIL
jgi:hypothetical protein